MKKIIPLLFVTIVTLSGCQTDMKSKTFKEVIVEKVFEQVRSHEFNPHNDDNSMVRSQAVITLGQIESGDFSFEHPQRLKL